MTIYTPESLTSLRAEFVMRTTGQISNTLANRKLNAIILLFAINFKE